MNNKTYAIYIDGKAIPVNEQVYRTYYHYERKERYFSYDLKSGSFSCNQTTETARFTPSREESYERLLESEQQFASDDPSVEEQVDISLRLKELLSMLTESEQAIVYQLYYLGKSEREACSALHLARTTFQRKKKALLKKIKELLEGEISEMP